MLHQHAELGAPITDVVETLHVVAGERQYVCQGVADDGRPEMADVHLLGNIGRGEINHNLLLVAANIFVTIDGRKGKNHAGTKYMSVEHYNPQ